MYACAWVWVRVCEWDAIWNWVLVFVCKTASTDDVMLCISNEMFQCAFMNCISPLRLTLAFSVDFIGKSHFDDFFMNAQIVVSQLLLFFRRIPLSRSTLAAWSCALLLLLYVLLFCSRFSCFRSEFVYHSEEKICRINRDQSEREKLTQFNSQNKLYTRKKIVYARRKIMKILRKTQIQWDSFEWFGQNGRTCTHKCDAKNKWQHWWWFL